MLPFANLGEIQRVPKKQKNLGKNCKKLTILERSIFSRLNVFFTLHLSIVHNHRASILPTAMDRLDMNGINFYRHVDTAAFDKQIKLPFDSQHQIDFQWNFAYGVCKNELITIRNMWTRITALQQQQQHIPNNFPQSRHSYA